MLIIIVKFDLSLFETLIQRIYPKGPINKQTENTEEPEEYDIYSYNQYTLYHLPLHELKYIARNIAYTEK